MINDLVTRGYGSFGSVNLLPTRGYEIGVPEQDIGTPHYFRVTSGVSTYARSDQPDSSPFKRPNPSSGNYRRL